ncbi:MAG: hypothetical protein Q8N98_01640, partial [bacterium]|nr:hypothetical protein [bacterium]
LVGAKKWEFVEKATGILRLLAAQESWQPVPTAFVAVDKAAQMVIEPSTLLVLARRGDKITETMFEGGVRVSNALGRSGITTLSSLAAQSVGSLLAVRDLRFGGLREILPVLRGMGGSTEAANLAGEIEAYLDTHHPCETTPEKRARGLLLRVTQEETIMVSGSLRSFFQRVGIGSSEIHRILSLQGYEQREEVFKILARKAQALIDGGDLIGEMAEVARLRFMERKPVGQIAVELGKEIRDISPILQEIRERIRKSLGMV